MEFSKHEYRFICMLVKKQDEQNKNIKNVTELFSSGMIRNHRKLVHHCTIIIFNNFGSIGKKCREILWRKGFYDIITTAKTLWNTNKQNEQGIVEKLKNDLKNFIMGGINIFKMLISKIRKNFRLDLHYLIDLKLIESYDIEQIKDDVYNLKTSCSKNINIPLSIDQISYATEVIYSLLISLGDLHRYYNDFNLNGMDNSKPAAANFYLQAFTLNPKIGMAHNQLGSLVIDNNYNIDSIYHYLYSLTSEQPFDYSENNVITIFRKNINSLEKDKHSNSGFKNEKFISKLIILIDVFYFDKNVANFDMLCHSVLTDLKDILKNINETFLTDDLIFKIVSILFFCMHKSKMINSYKISSLNAFMMAFCLELIDSCQNNLNVYIDNHIHLEKEFKETYKVIYEKYKNAIRSKMEKSVEYNRDLPGGTKTTLKMINEEINIHKRKNYRRRKKVSMNNSDSDSSDGNFQTDCEYNSDSSFDLYYDSTNFSDGNNTQSENEELLINISNTSDDKMQIIFKNRYSKINPVIILKFAEQEKTMKGLKILFDWLLVNLDILSDCYQSNPIFVHKLIKLLNYLNIDIFNSRLYISRSLIKYNSFRNDMKSLFDIRKSLPLQEDISLKMLHMLKRVQETLDWELNKKLDLTFNEESFLRIMKMVDLGVSICKSKKFDYKYCAKKGDFVKLNKNDAKLKRRQRIISNPRRMPKAETKQHTNIEMLESIESIEMPNLITKKGYLKNRNNIGTKTAQERIAGNDGNRNIDEKVELMGKLWLQNEVKSLETMKPVNFASTPYLVLDSKCLSEYTSIVKSIVKMKNFVILIPICVLTDLDELKKCSEGARNAIKWLEHELSKGNRYLRSQKSHEVLQLPLVKIQKNSDRDAKLFLQVMQFCNYIVSTNAGFDDNGIITYLSGDVLQNRKLNNSFSYVEVLHMLPMKFEQIVTFYSNQSKNGNK